MKAEADCATTYDARQVTLSSPCMRQTGGSVPGGGDKGQARALLDRVRAIRDEPHHQNHHLYQLTDHPYVDDDHSAPRNYERTRWQASSISGGGKDSRENEYFQPPSYSEAQSGSRNHHIQPHHQPHSYARHDDTPGQYPSPEPNYNEAHHSRRYGYDDVADTRRSREYADASTGSAGYHDQQNHHFNLLSPARAGDYRPRPSYGYGHGAQGLLSVPSPYAYPPPPPVARREGAWSGEPPRESDQFLYRIPTISTDAAYPPPRSYAPPLLEKLPGRRTSNPPTSPAFHYPPKLRTNVYDDNRHHHQSHRQERDERVVVRHKVRSPPRSKPRRAAPEVSSYQSTSNSSAQSFVSNEDDGESLEFRDGGDESDDDEAADADEEDDDDDAVSDPRHHALRLSKLSPEMYEDNELHSDFHHAVHMVIPANAFGCLIGNGGAIIRKINAQTRCTLSIRDPDAFSVKEDRVLRIYGKPKGICLAQHLAIERIRAHRTKKQDPNYMPLFHGCDGSDFLLLPSLPDSSVTRSMNDAVAELASNQSQRRSNGESVDRPVGSLKWLLPSDSVGKVMGTAGAILAAIARECNTKIHITPTEEMPRGSKERTVTIFGAPENIEAARQRIEKKAGGHAQTHIGKCGQYFAIPHMSTGALIGIKGSVARRITEQSGARLQIPYQDHLPLGSVNGTVHIQGNKQQVEAAYKLVCSTVRADLAAFKRAKTPIPAINLVIKIIIPTRIACFLLEQRGRLIREVMEKAGAHAHFLPPFEDETRVCVFKGEPTAVFRAERLMLQFVAGDTIATKRSEVGYQGVLPREKRKRRVIDSDKEDEEDEEKDEDIKELSRVRGRLSGAAVRRRRREKSASANTHGRPINLDGNSDQRPVNGRSNKRGRTEQIQHGRQNDSSRGPRSSGDIEPDIINRLQAPLQSARTTGNPNKRQRQ